VASTYNSSDFRKGLKVQIDGVPFQMIEMNFRKPGKGAAFYECKLKNLIRGTVVDRTYRDGQTLEAADISEFTAQYLYRHGENFVFMNSSDYEQYELSAEQVGDDWRYLKEGLECTLMVWNNNPLSLTPPNHVVLRVEYAEEAAKGNTATNVQKPVKMETGAEFLVPAFIKTGDFIRIDTRTGEYIERTKDPSA
jgi:elongation factor P